MPAWGREIRERRNALERVTAGARASGAERPPDGCEATSQLFRQINSLGVRTVRQRLTKLSGVRRRGGRRFEPSALARDGSQSRNCLRALSGCGQLVGEAVCEFTT